MKNLIILLLSFVLSVQNIFSQMQINEFDCEYFNPTGTNESIGSPFGGRVKPNRTDLSGGQPAPENAYFPVLVIFIQFHNEPDDPRYSWTSKHFTNLYK